MPNPTDGLIIGSPQWCEARKKMEKITLTKKRLKSLDTAISLDNILYEKFRRLHEDFTNKCKQWNRRKQVIKVIRIGKDYNEALQIVREVKTDEGIYLEVR